ncbi:MAG TPA: hypothetical protein VGI66_03590 [Streptosporangiaceae bacterium]|jgi:phage-related protein
MAFDAGTIVARMDLDTAAADRKLKDFENRTEKVSKVHKVKLSAVFDEASLGKARIMFSQLDQVISKDAANRLRSSPQGSVLGALNALFSPHPVTGAPTPAQSASQGLLGKVAQQPSRNMPGSSGSSTSGQSVTEQTQQRTVDQAAQRGGLVGGLLSRIGGGGGGGSGGTAGSSAAGGLGRGLISGIGPNILGMSTKVAGGIGLGGSLLGALPALLGPLAALGVGGLGIGAGAGILKSAISSSGVSQYVQQYQQAQNALASATTAQQRKAAQQQMAGATQGAQSTGGAGFSVFNSLNSLQNSWQNFTAGFLPAAAKILSTVSNLFATLQPVLKGFFTSAVALLQPVLNGVGDLAKVVLPGLGQAFRIVAPLMRPFLDAIALLFKNFLPGLLQMLKAVQPILGVLEGLFGTLGSDIGKLFSDLAPVMKPAAVLLKALVGLIGSLLPIIGKLAAVFATALAPVFSQFAKVIVALEPTLTLIGGVLSKLAAAILGDLVSAFTALANLLVAISPSLKILATAFGQIFQVLENTGVFATLGDVLEKLVPVLANLINLLIRQLAPILPVIIQFISTFGTILIDLVAAGLGAVLTAITWLLQKLPWLVPVLGVLGAAWLALNLIMDANPIALIIIGIAALIGVIVLLATHWHQVWTDIKNWAMDAWNFLTEGWGKFLVPGLALIRFAVDYLSKHWSAIWGDIEQIAKDFWTWIWTDFGQKIFTFLTKTLPGWFSSLQSDIKGYFSDAINWLLNGGKNIVTGLWNGLKAIWTDVTKWFEGLGKDILKALGINSPPAWAIQAGRDIMQGLGIGVSQGKSHVTSVMSTLAKTIGGIIGGITSFISGGGGNVAQLMQQMAAARGWTGAQWTALYNVEMREAGFNLNAKNPGSGAYGLAQFINGPSEYAQYGGNASTAAGQITGMLNYIAQRYGSPGAAWQHELNYGWYDQGGWLQPGATLALNNTGRPERILAGGDDQLDQVIELLRCIHDATRAVPRGVSDKIGAALGAVGSSAGLSRRYPGNG